MLCSVIAKGAEWHDCGDSLVFTRFRVNVAAATSEPFQRLAFLRLWKARSELRGDVIRPFVSFRWGDSNYIRAAEAHDRPVRGHYGPIVEPPTSSADILKMEAYNLSWEIALQTRSGGAYSRSRFFTGRLFTQKDWKTLPHGSAAELTQYIWSTTA